MAKMEYWAARDKGRQKGVHIFSSEPEARLCGCFSHRDDPCMGFAGGGADNMIDLDEDSTEEQFPNLLSLGAGEKCGIELIIVLKKAGK